MRAALEPLSSKGELPHNPDVPYGAQLLYQDGYRGMAVG